MAGTGPTSRRQLDATALAGLAHPLRVQLFEQLTHYGPATATQLAGRLAESSGATSYHLRQLERFGFVETDPDRGTGRERWWRRVPGQVVISTPELVDDPASIEAATLVVNEFQRGRLRRYRHWSATFAQWPREWQEASSEGSTHLVLTAAETRQLARELDDLLDSWKRRAADRAPAADQRAVELQHALFPLGSADGTDPGETGP